MANHEQGSQANLPECDTCSRKRACGLCAIYYDMELLKGSPVRPIGGTCKSWAERTKDK